MFCLEFDLDVILQNGQFYEAKMPLTHCPATSGCRALVRQTDGNSIFQLTENFVLTLKVSVCSFESNEISVCYHGQPCRFANYLNLLFKQGVSEIIFR